MAESGPFNIHFFRDVGLAFVASALALGAGVVLRDWRVALAGAGFPLLHGGLHLAEAVDHGPHGGPGELAATVPPALVAAPFNPDLKQKYRTMIQEGKPPKVALTARMRKLIELANALVQQDRTWTPKTA